jgi:hypothetical protein
MFISHNTESNISSLEVCIVDNTWLVLGEEMTCHSPEMVYVNIFKN